MKKLSKILVSMLTSFAFLCAPLFLVGCSGNSMSTEEVNEMLGKAADAYFDTHTEVATYTDTTYHWIKNTNQTGKITLNYNVNATDEEKVDGDFDTATTQSQDLTIAVKKFGENLICKMVYTSTVTNDGYELNTDDTAKHVVSTTRNTQTYRLYTYVVDSTVNYVLIGDISNKVDDGEATVSKVKAVFDNVSDYNVVANYMLKQLNQAISISFFGINGEIITMYDGIVTTQKDGDQVTIGMKYENVVNVDDTSFIVSKTSLDNKEVFENNKISKANSSKKSISKAGLSQTDYTFDIIYSATVDTIADISAYDGISNPLYYFEGILDGLPQIRFLG